MDEIKTGTAVGESPAPNGGQVRPMLADAKATAADIGKMGAHGGKREGSGRPKKTAVAPTVPLVPVPDFKWEESDVKLIGEIPFDTAYTLAGPDHEHWHDSSEKLSKSSVYQKFAYVLNKWQIKDPTVLILALASMQYLTAIGTCAAKSYKVSKAKDAEAEAKKPTA